MTLVLVLLSLAVGFGLGRLYQWLKGELYAGATDPAVLAGQAVSDIAAHTRRTEEQMRRLGQGRMSSR